MANVYATKTGNWSDTTVWNTAALPTSADNVYSNSFTVTVDGTYTVTLISNEAASGILISGKFLMANNSILTSTNGVNVGTASMSPIEFALTSGQTATLISNIINSNLVLNSITVLVSGAGIVNLYGNYTLGSSGAGRRALSITGTATVNLIGNVNHQSTGNPSNVTIVMSSNSILNITGQVTNTTTNASNGYTITMSNGTLNITGNVLNQSTIGNTITATSGTINITGNVTPSYPTGVTAINATGGIGLNIVGTITSSANQVAIILTNTSATVNVNNSVLINSQQIPGTSKMAVVAYNMTINPTVSFRWQFYNQTQTSAVNLYATGYVPDSPSISNVRNGITYLNGSLTGTMIVPPASSVLTGVPVDATVGTYTPTINSISNAIWNTYLSGITNSNTIGLRLKNSATVDSTAAQIAALK